MKKLLIGTAMLLAGVTGAAAADLLPTKAPPAPPAYTPAWTWTGFYLGANLGGGWTNSTGTISVIEPSGAAFSASGTTSNVAGVIGGGQIGYNWQTGPLVLGVEGDFDGSGQRVSNSLGCFNGPFTCTVNASAGVNWFATARGRIGWAVDRWMFYATGGGAWQNVSASASVNGVGVFSASTTRSGWVVGGGIEAALWDHWTIGAEYLYLDTGTFNNNGCVVGNPGCGFGLVLPAGSFVTGNVTNTNNIFRLRANYKF